MDCVMFDLDNVATLSSVKFTEDSLINEDVFYSLQKYPLLQIFYNRYFRKPNPEIITLMAELKRIGLKTGIISASNIHYYEELKKYLLENEYCLEALILKENPKENTIDFKKRVVPDNCDRYFDDREDIVRAINEGSDGKCKAILYTGQPFEELRRMLFPVYLQKPLR